MTPYGARRGKYANQTKDPTAGEDALRFAGFKVDRATNDRTKCAGFIFHEDADYTIKKGDLRISFMAKTKVFRYHFKCLKGTIDRVAMIFELGRDEKDDKPS